MPVMLSHAGIVRRLVRTSSVLFVLFTGANACAATRAACTIRAHIQLSQALNGSAMAGSFRSTRLGTIDCAGTLDGALSDGIGWIDATGSYRSGPSNPFGAPLNGFGTCVLESLRVTFLAAAPMVLSNRWFIRFDGTVRLTEIARLLWATGTGRAGTVSPISPGSEGVRYTGVGGFQPARGQDCTSTPIRSGTLTERFVITGPTR